MPKTVWTGQAEMDKEHVEPKTERQQTDTAPVEGNIDETPMDQGSPVFRYFGVRPGAREIRHIIERGNPQENN